VSQKAERDKRLDALEKASKEWAEKRKKQLTNEAEFAKRLLKSRKGPEKLANASVALAKDLVVDDIKTFLTGGS